mgnify:CR=1 FL=1
MENPKIIQQGAEAKILLDKINNQIIKDRIPKSYRLPELDIKIRTRRTRSEAKLLTKVSNIINSPIPLTGWEGGNKIKMPFIDGKKLSEHLDSFSLINQKQILEQIGKDIAKLHDADIIHGDLTTSNMILSDNHQDKLISTLHKKEVIKKRGDKISLKEKEVITIFFIDFGLGFFNGKFEDKAVDIHLLKQALEAKHFKHWKETYQSFLEGYKTSKNYEKTITQLFKVEKRGRYRH